MWSTSETEAGRVGCDRWSELRVAMSRGRAGRVDILPGIAKAQRWDLYRIDPGKGERDIACEKKSSVPCAQHLTMLLPTMHCNGQFHRGKEILALLT